MESQEGYKYFEPHAIVRLRQLYALLVQTAALLWVAEFFRWVSSGYIPTSLVFEISNHPAPTFPHSQAFILPSPPPSTASRAETAHSTTTTEASRLDFLRSAGAAMTVAAGAVLLPKASNAEVFTDDILGFKMDVSFHTNKGVHLGLGCWKGLTLGVIRVPIFVAGLKYCWWDTCRPACCIAGPSSYGVLETSPWSALGSAVPRCTQTGRYNRSSLESTSKFFVHLFQAPFSPRKLSSSSGERRSFVQPSPRL